MDTLALVGTKITEVSFLKSIIKHGLFCLLSNMKPNPNLFSSYLIGCQSFPLQGIHLAHHLVMLLRYRSRIHRRSPRDEHAKSSNQLPIHRHLLPYRINDLHHCRLRWYENRCLHQHQSYLHLLLLRPQRFHHCFQRWTSARFRSCRTCHS